MSDENPAISVVITGEDAAAVERTLRCLSAQAPPPSEVIVVGPPALQRALDKPEDLRFVAVSAPHPKARLVNMGLRAARGPFVCLLEAGAAPEGQDWLARMAAPLAEADVGAVCCRVRRRKDAPGFPLACFAELAVSASDLAGRGRKRSEPAWLTGRCDVFSAPALKEVAFLDDSAYPSAGWEKDMSGRLRSKGYRVERADVNADVWLSNAPEPGAAGVWRSALETGRSAAKLQRAHNAPADLPALCLMSLAALVVGGVSAFALPYAMIGACVLFLISWLHYVRTPILRLHLPAGLFHSLVFVVLTLVTRPGGAMEEWRRAHWPDLHPAFLRQYFFVASAVILYALVVACASLAAASRAARMGVGLKRLPVLFLVGLLWFPLTGIGYLRGNLEDTKG